MSTIKQLTTIESATGKMTIEDGVAQGNLTLKTESGSVELTLAEFDAIYAGFVRCWPAVKPLKEQVIAKQRELVAKDKEAKAAARDAAREQEKATRKAEREAAAAKRKAERDAAKAASKAKAAKAAAAAKAKAKAKAKGKGKGKSAKKAAPAPASEAPAITESTAPTA
jgi:hypothetical protein